MTVTDVPAFQNTGQEFDGSDSGARPDEAVSWGKIRAGAESVKVRRQIPLQRYIPLTPPWGIDRYLQMQLWYSPCW